MKFYQKSWFIVLMLIVFAPLGIYLMFRYTNWRLPVKIILTLAALFFFIPATIGTIEGLASPTSAKPSIETPSPTPSIEVTATPSEAPPSNEDRIIEAVKTEFGDNNYISVNYDSVNQIAQIKARGKEGFTEKSAIDGMYLNMSNVMENLSEIKDIEITFEILYPMVDEYGNATDTTVITATFSSSTRNKINWDYFLIENMPNVADEWWMHPVLISELQK